MKKFNGLMVLALLASAVSAQAGVPGFRPVQPIQPAQPAPIADKRNAPEACWPGENTPKSPIVDGVFGVYINVENLSGKEVRNALAATSEAHNALSNGAHFEYAEIGAQDYSDTLSATLKTEKRKDESRDQMIERASAAIKKLQAVPGVIVECEGRMFPLGGVSGSN